jgi:hypothetical protein
MWNESLPATLVMYLLEQKRAASRDKDEIFWYT